MGAFANTRKTTPIIPVESTGVEGFLKQLQETVSPVAEVAKFPVKAMDYLWNIPAEMVRESGVQAIEAAKAKEPIKLEQIPGNLLDIVKAGFTQPGGTEKINELLGWSKSSDAVPEKFIKSLITGTLTSPADIALLGGGFIKKAVVDAPKALESLKPLEGIAAPEEVMAVKALAANPAPTSQFKVLSELREGIVNTFIDRNLRSAKAVLQDYGEEGKAIADMAEEFRRGGREYIGGLKEGFSRVMEATQPTPEEFANVTKAIEAGSPANLSDKVKPLYDYLYNLMGSKESVLAQDAKLSGISGLSPEGKAKGAFEGLQNYWKGSYSEADLTKIKANQGRFEQHLVDSGIAPNKEAASALTKQWILRKAGKRVSEQRGRIPGAREFLREELGIDVSRTPQDVLDHIDSLGWRISQANTFGPKDERLYELIQSLKDKGVETSTVEKIVNRITGQEVKDTALNRFSGLVRNLQSMGKLGLSTTGLNYFQRLQTIPRTSLSAYSRAEALALKSPKEGMNWATKTLGLDPKHLPTHMFMSQKEASLGKATSKYLDFIGFSKSELGNRVRATLAGRFYSEELFKKLMSNPADKQSAQLLRGLGIDPGAALQRGKLLDKDLVRASQEVDRETQFWYDTLDLPINWTGPVGKIFTQFKPAAFQQAKYFTDYILPEAMKGHIAPLLGFITVAGVTGEAVMGIRHLMSLENPINKEVSTSRILDDLSSGPGIGIVSDTANMLLKGSPNWFPSFFLGPTVGESIDTAKNVQQLVTKGNVTPIGRQITKSVSRPLAKVLFPPKKKHRKK